MKKLTLSALVVIASSVAASAALAQDAAAGKASFNKCMACHAIGEGAKNKVGPELNGLDGRKSGTAEGYSYSDANKNSGITWNEAAVQGIHQGPEGQGSRHQDGVRRHQERKRNQRSLGVRLAIRQGRQDQVMRLAAPARLVGRSRRAVRELADQRLDLGDHEIGRRRAARYGRHPAARPSFASAAASANGRE